MRIHQQRHQEKNKLTGPEKTVSPVSEGEAPLKVLLWSAPGSGEHYSGPASFTYRLFSNAPPGDIELTLCHGFAGQQEYDLFKQQVFLGDHQKSSIEQLKFIHRGKRWLSQHAHEFDVMLSVSGYQYSMSPSLHAEKLGLPAAIFVANHHEQLGTSGGWRKIIRLHKKRQRMALKMSGFAALSQAIHDELLSYGVAEQRIVDIPMGVNTEVFKPADSAQHKQELRQSFGLKDMPTLLFVGTLVKRKRPDLLIKAVALLKERGVDCQLLICGPEKDSEYAIEMKAFAESAGVSDRIVWTGFIVDASPCFKAADYYSLPSSNEGMAASLVEAMASKVVPLVTPISGSEDLVKDGINGRYIKADEVDIADVLESYLVNPALAEQHAQAAYELVQQRYTDKVVYQQYLEMFRNLAKGLPARG